MKIVDRPEAKFILSGKKLKFVDVVGPRGEHPRGAIWRPLVAVQNDVDRPVFEEFRQSVPIALFEFRPHAQLGGEQGGQIDLEADDPVVISGVGRNVGTSPFLVRTPDERAAGANDIEDICDNGLDTKKSGKRRNGNGSAESN